jgi:hypothetical protein
LSNKKQWIEPKEKKKLHPQIIFKKLQYYSFWKEATWYILKIFLHGYLPL